MLITNLKKYKVISVKKILFTLITYICALSSLYSLKSSWEIEIGAEAKIFPITADFYNKFSLTGFNGEVYGAFICCDKFGLSWQISDNYLSQNTYSGGLLPSGASNLLGTGVGFVFLPTKKWRFEFKQNFLWNQSAYDINEKGILSETQIGTSTNINVFFTPSPKFPYLHISQHNDFRFYPITRSNNFQWEYMGTLRFTANPYIKKIGLFAEAGFLYLNADTPAMKYDSFSFIWDVGINFSYRFENKRKNDSPSEMSNISQSEMSNISQVKIFDVSKVELSSLPQVKQLKRPELYFDFYNASVGENIHIKEIYFNEKNQLTKESCLKLEALASYLIDYPSVSIVVVSYVESSIKNDEEIMTVSAARTNSVKDFLVKNKVSESQIKRSPSAIIFNSELSKEPYLEIKILRK